MSDKQSESPKQAAYFVRLGGNMPSKDGCFFDGFIAGVDWRTNEYQSVDQSTHLKQLGTIGFALGILEGIAFQFEKGSIMRTQIEKAAEGLRVLSSPAAEHPTHVCNWVRSSTTKTGWRCPECGLDKDGKP